MKSLGPILFLGIIGITSYLYFDVSLDNSSVGIYEDFSEFSLDSTQFLIGGGGYAFPEYDGKDLKELNPFRNSSGRRQTRANTKKAPVVKRGTYRLKGLSDLKSAIIELPSGQTVVAEPGDEFDSVKLIDIGESFILLQDKHGRFKIELGDN